MRFLTTCFLVLAMAGVSLGATVYSDTDPGLAGYVVPDLNNTSFDLLDFTLATNDVDTKIDYTLSYTGYDSAGTLTLISSTAAIPGVSPAIDTWLDATAGSGTDGGHVSLQLVTYDAAVAYDPDDLFGGRDGALVSMGTEVGGDPRVATIAVPEPSAATLGGAGILGLLVLCRGRRRNRAA